MKTQTSLTGVILMLAMQAAAVELPVSPAASNPALLGSRELPPGQAPETPVARQNGTGDRLDSFYRQNQADLERALGPDWRQKLGSSPLFRSLAAAERMDQARVGRDSPAQISMPVTVAGRHLSATFLPGTGEQPDRVLLVEENGAAHPVDAAALRGGSPERAFTAALANPPVPMGTAQPAADRPLSGTPLARSAQAALEQPAAQAVAPSNALSDRLADNMRYFDGSTGLRSSVPGGPVVVAHTGPDTLSPATPAPRQTLAERYRGLRTEEPPAPRQAPRQPAPEARRDQPGPEPDFIYRWMIRNPGTMDAVRREYSACEHPISNYNDCAAATAAATQALEREAPTAAGLRPYVYEPELAIRNGALAIDSLVRGDIDATADYGRRAYDHGRGWLRLWRPFIKWALD